MQEVNRLDTLKDYEDEVWQCKYSPTLGGGFDGTPEESWGTKEYQYKHIPTVFMGCYSYNDFLTVFTHSGRKAILWCGGDILRLTRTGYWLHDSQVMTLDSNRIAKWINENCENYCENIWEYDELKKIGIESKIVPSFLGRVEDYEISFKPGNEVYASCSGDNFEQYGWYKIAKMAKENPDIKFHLYGRSDEALFPPELHVLKNVIDHGRVDKRIMNSEIKDMQAGIRLLAEDGFSEVLAKSILWGQYPISEIEYPYILKPNQLRMILDKKVPNFAGRSYYANIINHFPWNFKKINKI